MIGQGHKGPGQIEKINFSGTQQEWHNRLETMAGIAREMLVLPEQWLQNP